MDTTVIRTTGTQTMTSKTLSSGSLSGTCNISGLGSNTSTFVMCYNGNFMYRGPFIAALAAQRAALFKLPEIMGASATQVTELADFMEVNGMPAVAPVA